MREFKHRMFSNDSTQDSDDGLDPKSASKRGPQWNPRQIIWTAICVADTTAMGAYVIFQAQDIEEYMEAIFLLTAVVGIEAAYIAFIQKNDRYS